MPLKWDCEVKPQPSLLRESRLFVMWKRMVHKDVGDGSRTITAKDSGRQFMDGLRRMRKEREMCDVIFKVDGLEVFAHRIVLAVHSHYFRAMFAHGFHEMQARDITLGPESSVDWLSAETLVEFMYSGHMTVTSANVQGLIMAADLWQMLDVKNMCVDFMESQIDTQNCLGVLDFSEVYKCEKLNLKCIQVIKQCFPVVCQSEEFLHLSSKRLLQILQFTDLALGFEGEDVVLKAVIRWVSSNVHQRLSELPTVLQHVRLANTSRECRKQQLQDNPTIQESEEALQVIDEMLQEPSDVRVAQTSLYVIGGFLQSRTGPLCPRLNSVERLDPVTGRWEECGSLPFKAAGSFSFTLFGHLFCAAFQPIDLNQRVAANLALETDIFEYNFVSNKWNSARAKFSPEALDAIDNCLQAEGALAVCQQSSTIYTVSHSEVAALSANLREGEVHCRSVRLLSRLTDVLTPQHRLHAACVLDRRLYVLGGDRHDEGSDPVPTGRVIMYDGQRHCWVEKAPMWETRAKLAVAVWDGHIYACGGFNVRRLESMERYDPTTNTWTRLQPMTKYRSHHQLLVLGNKLWAIGGKSYAFNNGGARKVLNLCEVYDPETNTWTEGQAMKYARCGFSAAAV